MHDPGSAVRRLDLPPKRRGGGCARLAAIAVVLVLASRLVRATSDSERSTCAACRLDRTDYCLVGFRWHRFEPSECSRWYADHVERSHPHLWSRYTHCRSIGIPGLSGGYACRYGDPVADLGKSFQLWVYQRFQNPLEAKALFAQLGRHSPDSLRTIQGLNAWADAGEGEPWAEWWARHCTGLGVEP